MRRMIGPKGDCNVQCGKFHNEELHSLYRSPNAVRAIKCRRWTDHVARMVEDRSVFKILTGKSIGKIHLGRPG